MEDTESSGSSSPRGSRNTNIAQRFSRQISRTILPALRNLVRSNRQSPRRSSTISETSNVNTSQDILPTPIPPEPTENIIIPPQSPSPLSTDSLINNVQEPAAQEIDQDEPPALVSEPPSPTLDDTISPLQLLTNLGNLDNNEEHTTTDTPTEENMDTSASPANGRQRYRLMVYFEERSQEEHPTARYVAIIVGRLDELQFLLSSSNSSERGFTDLLNNLFTSYMPKGTPPAAKNIIDSLPTVTVTDQEQSCRICLENFEVGSTAVVLPCSHSFHGEQCVKSWLQQHNTCPICRYELPVEDPEYETQRKERMHARGFDEEHAHSHAVEADGDVDMTVNESDSTVGGDGSQ